MSDNTNYTETANTYEPGYEVEGYDDDPYSGGFIAGTGKISSLITGTLAERVLARLGLTEGDVTIIEDHWDIGYCVTCSDEMIDFEVQVNGERVFRTNYASGGGEILGADALTGYAQFNEWLNGEEE